MDVADIVLINQLLARYGHVVDARAWDQFGELFLDDAEIDYRGVNAPAVLHGLEAITGYFRDANHPSAHHCTNVYVWEDEQGAVRAQSKFFVPYTRETHHPRRWYGGDYEDLLERTPDGWRFRLRSCSARWMLTADDGPIVEHRRTW